MAQIAAVENPDSASHFICDAITDGRGNNNTHHLINERCRDCKRTGAQIRKEAGLPW